MRYTPCEKHRSTAAELERLIQSTTTADELRTFSGDQRQLLQDVVSCPDCKVEDRSQRCVKCGEAWRADTGKAPCAAGGQCEIPAARKVNYVARCAICLDTSPHCACSRQGNGYWAPGSSSRAAEAAAGKPCACLICLDAAKRGVETDQVAEFPPLPMTDEQRVAALCANGHDAHLLRDRRIVLRLHGRVYRVVGGDFVRPSLMQVFDLGQKGSSQS
jgi:hypothetical protein